MNLTAIDFFGKVVWTGGTDDERAARLRAYEATGMEPEEIVEMKQVQIKAVDAVPVVRCKDCIHSEPLFQFMPNGTLFCNATDLPFPADGFCSRGVRKEIDNG